MSSKRGAFTLTELVITMVVLTLVMMIIMPLTKKKIEKVDTYSYYMGYVLAKEISVLLDESMLSVSSKKTLAFSNKLKKIINKNEVVKLIQASVGINPAYAGFCNCYTYDCPNESDNHQEQIDCGQESHWKYVWGSYRCSADCDCYCDEPEPTPEPQECLGTCSVDFVGTGPNAGERNGKMYYNIKEADCYKHRGDNCGMMDCETEVSWTKNENCTTIIQPDPQPEPEPEQPTLPTRQAFCIKIKDTLNISSESCSSSDVASGATDFKDITPHIVFTNGLKLYLSGGGEIPELSDSANADDKLGFVLYIDVNGNSGNSKLYEDVFPFYLLKSGKIVPGYSSGSYSGASSKMHLSLNLLYDSYMNGNRTVKVQLKDANFRSASCRSGYVTSKKYCTSEDNKVIQIYDLCKSAYHDCRMIVNKPFRIF